MFNIEYSSTGLGCDWEPVPDSRSRTTAEEARQVAWFAWSICGKSRDWFRVIREGSLKPIYVFMGGNFRINLNKWQRIPARRMYE